MSLHAQLSPEARQQHDARRRNSTILSIVISFLVIVLLGLILAFIFLPALLTETPVLVSYSASATDDASTAPFALGTVSIASTWSIGMVIVPA